MDKTASNQCLLTLAHNDFLLSHSTPPKRLTCDRYSKYLEFPELTAAQVRDIDSKLENMLLKLDEFNAVFERVRSHALSKYFYTRSDT